MRIIATIEVRMGSTRSPGKALADIAGKPLLERVIERIRLCKSIDDIVIATSTNPLDGKIEDLAGKLNVRCYRGSEDDVLDRVVKAAEYMKADVTAQFGGDSPFIDWKLTDELIRTYLKDTTADLVTNCLKLTYPLGVYTYVVPMSVMKTTQFLAKRPAEREDVTRYIWEHPERFKLVNIEAGGELRRPELRLTVDYEEDIMLTREVYAHLLPERPEFITVDVINFLDSRPELRDINRDRVQKSAPHIKTSRKIYRAAIIGCGAIAGGFDEKSGFKHAFTHAGAYKKHPRFELTAIAENNRERLSEFQKVWQVKKAYADYRELLEKEEIDVLSICAPDRLHSSLVNQALDRGTVKCILEEKPVALDLKEAVKIVESCRKKKVSLYINYNRLWDPLHHAVKEILSEGFLGTIQGCTAYYVRGIKHNGTTMISALRFLLGEDIVHAQALGSTTSEIEGDPAMDALFTMDSGRRVTLIAADKSGYGHSIFEIDIIGNKGRIRLVDNGFGIELYRTGQYKRYPGVNALIPVSPEEQGKLPKSGMDRTLINTLDEILLSLEDGALNLKHAEEAVKDLRVAEALIESSKRGGIAVKI